MDLYELPHELFISIIQYLSPKELVLNRRVSKKSYNAFTEQEACRYMLLQHYPESREARGVSSVSCWADAFAEAASRYEHLKSGKTKSIEKHMLKSTVTFPALAKYYAVAPWDGQSIYEQKTIPFECPDTLWTYDEGLLIFPSAELQQYMLYDLNTGIVSIVDFHVEDKIVRRIRLNERVLIVEWSELDAYHRINEDGDMLFRHFATAYDLIQDSHEQWSIAFRSEWKIHKLGMALNSHDRFFSTHTATHYAIYIWQPNQSVWGENEPLEALAIWDIKSPSSYRPSLDPQARSKLETSEGPHVIRHFYLSDLTFNNIRQGSTPSLQNLELDESNIYIFSKEYSWLIDSQSGSPHSQYPTSRPDRYDHSARCTGIPFASGPRWEIRCGDDGTGVYCWSSQEYYRPSQAPCWILNVFLYPLISLELLLIHCSIGIIIRQIEPHRLQFLMLDW